MFSAQELDAFLKVARYVAVNDYEGKLLEERTGRKLEELARGVQALVYTQGAQGSVIIARGFVPNAYKGLGIDESGCIICHNGNRQATDQAGGHQNLVANPFGTFDKAPQLYENNCAQCHGATGEGGKGPPLNDQNRLGFFNDDYYYRCIYLGNTGEEHKGTIMPAWGANKLLPQPINANINLLVHWVRMWQQYTSRP